MIGSTRSSYGHGPENFMKSWPILLAVICWGLVLTPQSASAQLLFAGGEDIDFICNGGGSCATNTTAGTFRSGWAREAYSVLGTASDPPSNRFATPVFAANSTLWIHGQYCNTTNTSACISNLTTSNVQLLRVLDGAGYPTLVIRATGTSGQLKISSRTSSGVFTDLVTCSSAFNSSLTQLDFFVNYGTSGEVTLYNGSVPVCDYTGNVTNGDGATTLNQVELTAPLAGNNGTGGQYGGAWSEVIVATTRTTAMSRL